jgi:prepilin-type N-terminal cleavage/methylation domain-containing protein
MSFCFRSVSSHTLSAPTAARRRGLTLLELVVVLSILAALAAIVAPLLPNLLRRAHKATDATQSAEVSKAVQMYQASFLSYPDNFDLLTDGTSATFPSYLPKDGGNTFGGFVTAAQLSDDQLKALGRVGLLRFQKNPSTVLTTNDFHPTMRPYASATPTLDQLSLFDANGDLTSAAQGAYFATLNLTAIQAANPSFLQTIRDADPTAQFVVFGVGPRTTMVGQVIQDAPTSVPQNKQLTPANTYCRVGVIFQIDGVEVQRTERARFVAAVAMEDDELETTEKDIVGYYQVSQGNQ